MHILRKDPFALDHQGHNVRSHFFACPNFKKEILAIVLIL